MRIKSSPWLATGSSHEDSPPAWSTRLEFTETPRIPCRVDPPPPRLRRTRNVAGIPPAGVPSAIIPATPPGGIHRALRLSSGQARGDGTTFNTSPPPLCLPSRNRGVYFGHGISVGEINATFVFSVFSVPSCLQPYSAGGESSCFEPVRVGVSGAFLGILSHALT
jgi:hypothetical protein